MGTTIVVLIKLDRDFNFKRKFNQVCKEPLPAPGNRSNERRYTEKDLATTERKKVGTGEESGGEGNRGREK
ncbi:hypothetical protein TNCV_1801951 [Trichonephila clavipes]|nr:hypothetical protein TNCV_1801951 [Trichonephila clavipes]